MKVVRFFTVAGLWVGGPSVLAQQPSGDACAEASRLVTSAEATDAHAGWALAHIVSCPDGPTAIATRWRTAKDRPEVIAQLRGWNHQIRDQRIAEAVMAVARDQSRSPRVRLVALHVLVSYFDRSATVELRDLENPPKFPALAHVTHSGARVGAEPPAQNLPDRVYALARELAADPHPRVAGAARLVWQVLTDARPSVASVLAGTVTLDNVCGARFRIANQNDIDLSVELAVTSGKPGRPFRLPARATREIGATDTGSVRLLLYRGPELTTARTGPECR